MFLQVHYLLLTICLEGWRKMTLILIFFFFFINQFFFFNPYKYNVIFPLWNDHLSLLTSIYIFCRYCFFLLTMTCELWRYSVFWYNNNVDCKRWMYMCLKLCVSVSQLRTYTWRLWFQINYCIWSTLYFAA